MLLLLLLLVLARAMFCPFDCKRKDLNRINDTKTIATRIKLKIIDFLKGLTLEIGSIFLFFFVVELKVSLDVKA
jgi:hypothetical protein